MSLTALMTNLDNYIRVDHNNLNVINNYISNSGQIALPLSKTKVAEHSSGI